MITLSAVVVSLADTVPDAAGAAGWLAPPAMVGAEVAAATLMGAVVERIWSMPGLSALLATVAPA